MTNSHSFLLRAFPLALVAVTLFSLAGCNCEYLGNGYVYDRETRQPLEGAEVSIHLSSVHDDTLDHRVYTDVTGAFAIAHQYCTNYMVDHYKEGYVGHVAPLSKGDTIWLDRLTEEYQ